MSKQRYDNACMRSSSDSDVSSVLSFVTIGKTFYLRQGFCVAVSVNSLFNSIISIFIWFNFYNSPVLITCPFFVEYQNVFGLVSVYFSTLSTATQVLVKGAGKICLKISRDLYISIRFFLYPVPFSSCSSNSSFLYFFVRYCLAA